MVKLKYQSPFSLDSVTAVHVDINKEFVAKYKDQGLTFSETVQQRSSNAHVAILLGNASDMPLKIRTDIPVATATVMPGIVACRYLKYYQA